MKRIDPQEAAIEGVITRHGTLVGPLMTELTGFPELTPYGGGWCGNDVFATALTERQRVLAREYTQRMGDRLRRGGLPRLLRARLPRGRRLGRAVPRRAQPARDRRELDDERHRGRVRRHAAVPLPPPRVRGRRLRDRRRRAERGVGASRRRRRVEPVHPQADRRRRRAHHACAALGDLAARRRRRRAASASCAARPTGTPSRARTRPSTCGSPPKGQYRYPGADLGILVTRGRLQTDDHELTERALTWIRGIKSQFRARPRRSKAALPPPEPFSFKML